MMVAAKFARTRRAVVATALAAFTAAGLAGAALAASHRSATTAAGGPVSGGAGSGASVPWPDIGPGWTLAEYSASSGGEGVAVRRGTDTLYLVDPAGRRYVLAAWPRHSAPTGWQLEAWSGDSGRALFVSGGLTSGQQVHQLDLRTGKFTSFSLPMNVSLVGYTRPDGLNILAQRGIPGNFGGPHTLLRYDLQGTLRKTLGSVRYLGQIAYQPGGAELAAGWLHGLELIGNAGGVIRKLPVPGEKNGCGAVRWWSAGTILASCATDVPGPRLWLIPASGAAPRALTPVRRGGFDAGDFDAWELSSGLYLNSEGACDVLTIGRQPAHGPEIRIDVPGSVSSMIITATRSRLLVQRMRGCAPGASLAWFNPVSRTLKLAVPVTGRQWGVIAAVPYSPAGKF